MIPGYGTQVNVSARAYAFLIRIGGTLVEISRAMQELHAKNDTKIAEELISAMVVIVASFVLLIPYNTRASSLINTYTPLRG